MTTKKRSTDPKKARVTGIARGLTNYGDADFSLYMRRSFAKSMGYSPEMLARPVVGIAQTASGFNNCHRHFPELVEAVKRGVIAAGGLPLRFPDDLAGRGVPQPDQHDVPQPHGDGRGGNDPRAADGCGGADRRLRQDRAGAADGRGLGRPARDPAGRRPDAAEFLQGRAPRRLHRLPPLLGQVPRQGSFGRRDRRDRRQSRHHRRQLRGNGHRQHHGRARRGAGHDPARHRGDSRGARRPAARGRSLGARGGGIDRLADASRAR